VVTKPTINSYIIADRVKSSNKIKELKNFDMDILTETDRPMSRVSATSTIKKFKKNIKF